MLDKYWSSASSRPKTALSLSMLYPASFGGTSTGTLLLPVLMLPKKRISITSREQFACRKSCGGLFVTPLLHTTAASGASSQLIPTA